MGEKVGGGQGGRRSARTVQGCNGLVQTDSLYTVRRERQRPEIQVLNYFRVV